MTPMAPPDTSVKATDCNNFSFSAILQIGVQMPGMQEDFCHKSVVETAQVQEKVL
jgi:hypothetical protein